MNNKLDNSHSPIKIQTPKSAILYEFNNYNIGTQIAPPSKQQQKVAGNEGNGTGTQDGFSSIITASMWKPTTIPAVAPTIHDMSDIYYNPIISYYEANARFVFFYILYFCLFPGLYRRSTIICHIHPRPVKLGFGCNNLAVFFQGSQ